MRKEPLAASLLLSLGVMLVGGCGNEAQTPTPAPEKDSPAYGLPLEITIEGVPEVPEEIRGPYPPIEEKEEEE